MHPVKLWDHVWGKHIAKIGMVRYEGTVIAVGPEKLIVRPDSGYANPEDVIVSVNDILTHLEQK